MIACISYFPIQDQPLMAGITEQVVAIVRKISSGSSRDLPPSYSKVISDRCLIQLRSKFCHTIYSKTPFQFRLEEGFFNEELLKYFLMGFLGWFDSGRFDNQRSPQSSSSLRRSHWRRSIRRHQVRRQGCSKAYSQHLKIISFFGLLRQSFALRIVDKIRIKPCFSIFIM